MAVARSNSVRNEREGGTGPNSADRNVGERERSGLRQILKRLIAALAEGPPAPFYDVNTEFHELLYDAALAQFIAGQTRSLRRRVVAYRPISPDA